MSTATSAPADPVLHRARTATTTVTMREAEQQTGLPAPTLRYYEAIGLIGPIGRDGTSGHRRYAQRDLDDLQALACLRAMGVGVQDMRTYRENRARGAIAAGEQRDLLLRHAERVRDEVERLRVHVRWLDTKAALWDARARGDAEAEAEVAGRIAAMQPALEAAIR